MSVDNLRAWIADVRAGSQRPLATRAMAEVVNNLLNDYHFMERMKDKRTEYMRTALHSIYGSEDEMTANQMREIAYQAVKADTQLANLESEREQEKHYPVDSAGKPS